MEEKKVFKTDKAAVTGGPYSQAIIHNGIIYVSGQGAVDPQTNEIKLGTVEEEAELGLTNLQIILEEAGSSLDKVLTVAVYLLDIEEYTRFNEVYKKYFKENRPARTCIQAGSLPFNTRVEITATACV
ncbi:MAG: reactive intermediate/imine deaminase [Deltaproteobacteria bacterium]|nr:reactive intermediate/imine deaminase [Deltaproteobacteria bacterium]